MGKYTLAWNSEIDADTAAGCFLLGILVGIASLFVSLSALCPGGSNGICSTSATCLIGAVVIGLVGAVAVGGGAFVILCLLSGLCVAELEERKPKVKK